MKKLLFFTFLALFTLALTAQNTYQISWAIGSNGDDTTFTVDVGDIVIWNWDDTATHTVTNLEGSTESFDSGFLTGLDESFSYTFMAEGVNPYQCNVHPDTMFGTITVQEVLGLEDNVPEGFKLISNITTDVLTLILPAEYNTGTLKLFNLNGNLISTQRYEAVDRIEADLVSLSDGVYIVSISSNGSDFAKRFIKQ